MPKFKCIIVETHDDIGRPPSAMRAIGFTYLYAIPRPICDSWEFYCCEVGKLPKNKLPSWARSVGLEDASKVVGLSADDATKCNQWIADNFPA